MITKKFEEEYGKLNARQKEAVDSIDGPVMVIAGPGTGKTTVLILRIANILRMTDTPASGILALTFTENGAKNMKAKLRELIGDLALEVPIHTFHGFASKIIAEFQNHFPHLARSTQITEVETETILRKILRQREFYELRPLGDPDFYIPKIIQTISDAKQEAWTPEMLESFAREEIEKTKKDQQSISAKGKSKGNLKAEALAHIEKCKRTILFARIYEAYENKKRLEKKMDFNDLIFELLKALREDKLLLQILQEKFLYILIDEHQDTNGTQNLIVRTIADFFDTPNLFVVGDEKQAIYRFQGASVENFLNFQKIWGHMKVISLADNYRSHQHIIDASSKMIEKNYENKKLQIFNTKLRAESKEKKRPLDLIEAPDLETEETYILKEIRRIAKESKKETVAVIVRKNNDVARIFSLAETEGLPVSAERGFNVFSHPIGLLFFSLLEFFSDPTNIEALTETFISGLWRLDFQKKIKMVKMAKSGNIAQIEKEIPEIENLFKKINTSGVLDFFDLIANYSGFAEITSRDPVSVEIWRSIIALSEEIAKSKNIESPKMLIAELLSYKKTAEHRVVKINTGQIDSQITIMTAHASKGLEFDYVFLPYATEESWFSKNRSSYFVLPKEKEKEDDLKDERRLFYVSLTRARKHVCISFHSKDNLGKIMTPLRFINELDQNLISRKILDKNINTRFIRNKAKKTNEIQNLKCIGYAKRVLLENGLSVTALNHFIKCPSEFFYKSILKLPESLNPSSEKGIAMHEAIAKIWKIREKKREEKIIKSTMIGSIKDYFRHSLLPIYEKEKILEELSRDIAEIAIALRDHFFEKGRVITEARVETCLDFDLNGKKISLKLHGKLDALIEQENKLLVFDYKTRKAMSLNAIRGDTKENKGDYFRQLIFYKILLEKNKFYKQKKIEPSLVFVKPDKKGRCPIISVTITESDIKRVKAEIETLLESVWTGKLLEKDCDDKDCKYCKMKRLI